MRTRVLFEPVAETEVASAHNWYRLHSKALTTRFLAAVDEAVDSMASLPLSHAAVTAVDEVEIRRVRLKRFPYALFFVVLVSQDEATGEAVQLLKVVGLRHDKQRAVDWIKRLP